MSEEVYNADRYVPRGFHESQVAALTATCDRLLQNLDEVVTTFEKSVKECQRLCAELTNLRESHDRLKASYVANPEYWRSRCEMLETEVERLRKRAMQHAKEWKESGAEALAQENEIARLHEELMAERERHAEDAAIAAAVRNPDAEVTKRIIDNCERWTRGSHVDMHAVKNYALDAVITVAKERVAARKASE
jgi:DNA repair exonuclease SbcCD ATPase subunit